MTFERWLQTTGTTVAALINRSYPLRHDAVAKKLAYGTAGFRTDGALLAPVAVRVIIIAVLRAMLCSNESKRPAVVGFMVTASHNPAKDNGFKIIDSDGGMLAENWEIWCGKAANAVTGEDMVTVMKECMTSTGLALTTEVDDMRVAGGILLARDTRDSGREICAAVRDVLYDVFSVHYVDFNILTTPQLHYMVRRANTDIHVRDLSVSCGLDAYHNDVLLNLKELMTLACQGRYPPKNKRRIVVDAANGVGAIGLRRLLEFSAKSCAVGDVLAECFDMCVVNDNTSDASLLNTGCGADFAKTNQRPSSGMEQWAAAHPQAQVDVHYYCLDGDADRLVGFSHSRDMTTSASVASPSRWQLLDGDRIAILYAMLLNKWLGAEVLKSMDVGIVQTGYANGASTAYVADSLGMCSYMAATGVKKLHPVAHARDIGVYFEANGHGTVLFNQSRCERVLANQPQETRARASAVIAALSGLLSQVCGDAISDMLVCEIALQALQLSFGDWLSLYHDWPSLQTKVAVPDPRVITNTADETRALTPAGLQEAVDAAVARAAMQCGAARSFVRPSGTEPIVRVYAEAATPEARTALADEIGEIVRTHCS